MPTVNADLKCDSNCCSLYCQATKGHYSARKGWNPNFNLHSHERIMLKSFGKFQVNILKAAARNAFTRFLPILYPHGKKIHKG